MQGENLNSLSMGFYSVAVGRGSCSISFITDTQVVLYILLLLILMIINRHKAVGYRHTYDIEYS